MSPVNGLWHSSGVDVTSLNRHEKQRKQCSPGRKPWGNATTCEALKGRKKAFPDIASWFCCRCVVRTETNYRINFSCATKRSYGMLTLMCFPPVAGLAARDTKSNRPASSSDRPLATSKCDDGKRKPAIDVSCRNDRWVKRSVLTHRLIATMKYPADTICPPPA